MIITEKEVVALASSMIQGICSNPAMVNVVGHNASEQILFITNSINQCRIALLKAGYTIYPIKI